MKAVCWYEPKDVRVVEVPDARIINPRDAVVRITSSTICGSDLHLYDGYMPTMMAGDILGHEAVGEVVEVGPAVRNVRPGDKVVILFHISCGNCWFCKRELYSVCDNSNPNGVLQAAVFGHPTAGIFGYSHLLGGYAGCQAEMVRVPYADMGLLKVPASMPDEQALTLADIFPTGYQAAVNADIKRGDVVAVWGCGPVGQFVIRSAFLLGAERVIAIDRFADRLELAAQAGAEPVNYEEQDVQETLDDWTGGRGPDACVDAVGMEAHHGGLIGMYDKTKQTLMLESERPHVLRQIIYACRAGGTLSIPGVYAGLADKIPFGVAFNKGLTWRMGQTHMHKWAPKLLEDVLEGRLDPSFIFTHEAPLESAADGYEVFKHKRHGVMKIRLDCTPQRRERFDGTTARRLAPPRITGGAAGLPAGVH